MALIRCNECGQMISDKAKRCPKCGCQMLGAERSPYNQKVINNSQVRSKSNNTVFYIICGVLLASFLGIGAYLLLRSTNKNVTEEMAANETSSVEPKKAYDNDDIYDYNGVATHEFIESQIPFLSSRELTEDDISRYNSKTLRLMRNSLFATRGYKFKSKDLQEYFSQYPWYTPRYNDVSNQFSQIELYNIYFLKNHE